MVLAVASTEEVGRAASWAKGADPILFESELNVAELALSWEQAGQKDKMGHRDGFNSTNSTSDAAILRATEVRLDGRETGLRPSDLD